jgi:hypothetical protein
MGKGSVNVPLGGEEMKWRMEGMGKGNLKEIANRKKGRQRANILKANNMWPKTCLGHKELLGWRPAQIVVPGWIRRHFPQFIEHSFLLLNTNK